MATVSSTVADLTERFSKAGFDSPRLDARMLVGAALGLEPSLLFARGYDPVSDAPAGRIEEFARRRLAHEPVSRILGTRGFYGLSFRVTPATLDPRPETETVVAAVLDARPIVGDSARILDLGTGTGCLLLAILNAWPEARGMGIDISEAALAVARENATALGLGARTSFALGDWAQGLSGPFDIIVSNPPSIAAGEIATLEPEVRDFDPRGALDGGPDGLACYRAILPAARALLSSKGRLFVEIGATQAEPVGRLAAASGLEVIGHFRDLAGHERCLALAVA